MKILCAFVLFLFSVSLQGKELKFKYYSEEVTINYDESICIKYNLKLTNESIKGFYDNLDKTNYQGLLKELDKYRVNFELNDFFYYKLIQGVSKKIYEDKAENNQIVLCWFILNKLGYNSNLRYVSPNLLNLYIFSNDHVNYADRYQHKGKQYVSLVFNAENTKYGKKANILEYFPNKKSKMFSFSIMSLPNLPNKEIIDKELFFNVKGRTDTLKIRINKTIIDLLNDFPHVHESEYFNVDLSPECSESIISYFQGKIKDMTKAEAIRYLLSFVRLAFKYEDDKICYGKEKPMIAEEVLYYPYADCEDKSALFFYLVKELLGISEIVLEYPQHINIAVLLDEVYGKPFIYKGKKYSVCETNVLGDSDRAGIGYSPRYEKYPSPKVIYEYNPSKKKKINGL